MAKKQKIYIIFTLLTILLGTGLIFYLSSISIQKHDHHIIQKLDDKNFTIEETSTTQVAIKKIYKDKYQPNDKNLSQLIKNIETQNLKDKLIESQVQINNTITRLGKNPEDLGYLYLPSHPSKYKNTESKVSQLDIPLILQKDPQWRSVPYGNTGSMQIGENGCAIASLAMVQSYLTNKSTTPNDILLWSKQNYFLANQGTSWNIFYDFAIKNNYNFVNYGNNFQEAMAAVKQGKVVVASVNPGFFTTVGHIIVIRGYENGKVYVNDPNDDPSKMNSIKPIDESIFYKEGANYWSFSKK